MSDIDKSQGAAPSDPATAMLAIDGEGSNRCAAVPTWIEAERLAALDRYAILDSRPK